MVLSCVYVDQEKLNNQILQNNNSHRGFPDSSVGKKFTCNAGDPGSIPELRGSTGEGKGYNSSILGLPLWLSW